MASLIYKDTGYPLSHLVEDIRHGRLALPDIQRPFVWTAAKVRDLLDSMYRGYPIGTLLLWETGAEIGSRPIGGGPARAAKLLVVDGQQRLTSLYAVLTGTPVLTKAFKERNLRIAFCPSEERFKVTDAAIAKDPEFVTDITALWTGSYKATVRAFLDHLRDRRPEGLTAEEQDLLEERIDRVRDLRDFRFQVIELSAEADEEEVAEIFVRINSQGVQLKQSDFILTLMSVHWEDGRRQLEAFCRDAAESRTGHASPRNPFLDPTPDQLLRVAIGFGFRRGRLGHVYSLLRGRDLESGEMSDARRVAQFARLHQAQESVLNLTNWHEFLKCLTAAGFRSRRMITSENAVLYAYVVWLIGHVDMGLDFPTLRRVISRWFFMSHTTGRYTSSPESQIESDLSRLAGLRVGDGAGFCSELDRIIAANFTDDYWKISLPNLLDTSAARSPALFAYWAALNLLDAEPLFSSMRIRDLSDPSTTPPRSLERHHLFPRAYLREHGISDTRQVDAIANMAYLEWPDNVAIGADDPKDYWPELEQRLPRLRLEQQMYWHALPLGWEQLEYDAFLRRRRALMAQVVRDGYATLSADSPLPHHPPSAAELLALGESDNLELKSSARWSYRTGEVDKRLEHVIVKTVCGFLNARGGTLLIGVDDSHQVVGLGPDYATLGAKGDRDGYELFLRQRLDADLSVPTAGLVRISFDDIDGKDVCRVSVAASAKPVFARSGVERSEPSEFWVRVGNATKQLHGDDMMAYRSTRWS